MRLPVQGTCIIDVKERNGMKRSENGINRAPCDTIENLPAITGSPEI
jgi:hypothetical protein